MAHIFNTKKRASDFCKKKNKYAKKYIWKYYKRDLELANIHDGGYVAYKTKK